MKDIIDSINLEELKSFKKNKVWMIIEDTLKERLELTRNDLERSPVSNVETFSSEGTLMKVRGVNHLQGSAEEIRYILALPDILIYDKEERSKENVSKKS